MDGRKPLFTNLCPFSKNARHVYPIHKRARTGNSGSWSRLGARASRQAQWVFRNPPRMHWPYNRYGISGPFSSGRNRRYCSVDAGVSPSPHVRLHQKRFTDRELCISPQDKLIGPPSFSTQGCQSLTLDFLRPSTRRYLQQALISTAPMVYCIHSFASTGWPRWTESEIHRERERERERRRENGEDGSVKSLDLPHAVKSTRNLEIPVQTTRCASR